VSELCQNHRLLSGAIRHKERLKLGQEPEILPNGARQRSMVSAIPRPENPGVGGSIPSLPTISFREFHTPTSIWKADLCPTPDRSGSLQRMFVPSGSSTGTRVVLFTR
jgi:hypothetical protein